MVNCNRVAVTFALNIFIDLLEMQPVVRLLSHKAQMCSRKSKASSIIPISLRLLQYWKIYTKIAFSKLTTMTDMLTRKKIVLRSLDSLDMNKSAEVAIHPRKATHIRIENMNEYICKGFDADIWGFFKEDLKDNRPLSINRRIKKSNQWNGLKKVQNVLGPRMLQLVRELIYAPIIWNIC